MSGFTVVLVFLCLVLVGGSLAGEHGAHLARWIRWRLRRPRPDFTDPTWPRQLATWRAARPRKTPRP